LLQQSQPYSDVASMAGVDGEHTSYSSHANLPPNHEVLPMNRIWQFQILLWRPTL
jgi:hypothetical protein